MTAALLERPGPVDARTFEAETLALLRPKFSDALRATFVHDLAGAPVRRDWLLKSALQARAFHLIVGEPGCGKSFLALDYGMSTAWAAADPKAPQFWFGRKMKPCAVVYIAAEGQDDFQVRLKAWLAVRGLAPDTKLPFILIPTAVDLRTDASQTDLLMADIAVADQICRQEFGVPVGVVFVDTVNRSLAGGDDAKAEHVGPFVRNCIKIRDANDVTVVGIHHLPKAGGSIDPRGHSSLKGDNDGQWFVSAATDDKPNGWAITRLKAGPTGAKHQFRLKQITVGLDEDGEPITSCAIAMPSDVQEEQAKAVSFKPNATELEFLKVLGEAIEKHGVLPPPGVPVGPATTLVVSFEKVRALYAERFELSEAGDERRADAMMRGRWSRATRYLRGAHVIGWEKPWLWLTGKRVQGFHLRGVTDDNGGVTGDGTSEITGNSGDVTSGAVGVTGGVTGDPLSDDLPFA